MDGWIDGWIDGWMGGSVGARKTRAPATKEGITSHVGHVDADNADIDNNDVKRSLRQ
jgi:hypothetical protein